MPCESTRTSINQYPATGESAGTPTGKSVGKSRRDVTLPVFPVVKRVVQPSRMGRRRAVALIVVHVLMIAHVTQWLIWGQTISPIEPSESMYTLNNGYVNAGVIFFAAAIVATLILGRFVCGWGCHFIAYQDLCGWLLKKIGIKPKPLRSRLLVFAPLALALYVFVWPTVYRWFMSIPAPTLENHLYTTEFWATFPGPAVTVLTVLVAGFAIVYFLGAKGFCTYACPYGGFFGLADNLAVGRIRVNDSCEHCGHCTSVCTSNVRVHEEVAWYGMVVDPGCMKCMDCVSVCPNDALSFGFGKPALGVPAKTPRRPVHYDFSMVEELIMVVVGLLALVTFRGLYGRVPLLMAMAIAGMTAFLMIKTVRLVCDANVRLQNFSLKRGGNLTRPGWVFIVATGLFFLFTSHSAAIQYHAKRGDYYLTEAKIGDAVWFREDNGLASASEIQRYSVDRAIHSLERADEWGLFPTYSVLRDLVWLYLAKEQLDQAEATLHRLIQLTPGAAEPHRGLGGLMRKRGRWDEALSSYRRALAIDPDFTVARKELCSLLVQLGQYEELQKLLREGLSREGRFPGKPSRETSTRESLSGKGSAYEDRSRKRSSYDRKEVSWALELAHQLVQSKHFQPAHVVLDVVVQEQPINARAQWLMGVTLLQLHRGEEGLAALQEAIRIDPGIAEAHYDLGMAHLSAGNVDQAIIHFKDAIKIKDDFALAHYNLAVACYMIGQLQEAVSHAEDAARADPTDPDAYRFGAMVLTQLGETERAKQATESARRRMGE